MLHSVGKLEKFIVHFRGKTIRLETYLANAFKVEPVSIYRSTDSIWLL